MKFIIFLLVGLVTLGSCGRNEFPNYDDKEVITLEEEQGNYRTEFKTLNKKWAKKVHGYSILWLRGNQFYARVSVSTRMPHVQHLQYIHEGTKCPGSGADINQDGVIDLNEVIIASGKVLIPLDGDLITRRGGEEGFPRGNEEGKYIYYRAASFREMMINLRGRPDHQYATVPAGAPLSLQERVIVVYGIANSMTFPIACGEVFEDYDPEE